jgi:hypothetical protein
MCVCVCVCACVCVSCVRAGADINAPTAALSNVKDDRSSKAGVRFPCHGTHLL